MSNSERRCPGDKLDGAVLFDDGIRLGREGVIGYALQGDRLGLVRENELMFRAEYFERVTPPDGSEPYWGWRTPFAFCGLEQDAFRLIEEYVATGDITPGPSVKFRPDAS